MMMLGMGEQKGGTLQGRPAPGTPCGFDPWRHATGQSQPGRFGAAGRRRRRWRPQLAAEAPRGRSCHRRGGRDGGGQCRLTDPSDVYRNLLEAFRPRLGNDALHLWRCNSREIAQWGFRGARIGEARRTSDLPYDGCGAGARRTCFVPPPPPLSQLPDVSPTAAADADTVG